VCPGNSDCGRLLPAHTSAEGAGTGTALSIGENKSWRRACLALFFSTCFHGLLIITLAQHAGSSAWHGASMAGNLDPHNVIVVRLAGQESGETPSAPLMNASVTSPDIRGNEREFDERKLPATVGNAAAETTNGFFSLNAPRYFMASELDRRPAPLTPVNLDYPANGGPGEGYLILRLLISETGSVERVLVVLSDSDQVLEETAAKTFGRVRFSPGIKNQIPVKSQILIEIKLHSETPGLN